MFRQPTELDLLLAELQSLELNTQNSPVGNTQSSSADNNEQSNDWKTGSNFKVVFSKYNQATLPECRLGGNQCTFMSLSAIIYSSLDASNLSNITKEEMNKILRRGNSYYESNMKEILKSHPNYFKRNDNDRTLFTSINDVHLKQVKIFDQNIVIKRGEELVGSRAPEPGMTSIAETLRDFLQSELPNRAGIVICGSTTRAIMKKTKNDGVVKYYLFDSHAFNSTRAFNIKVAGDENAAMVEFDSIDSLVDTYENLIPELPENIQLDVTEILSEKANENENNVSFTNIDNYISGSDGNLKRMLDEKFEQEATKSSKRDLSITPLKNTSFKKKTEAEHAPKQNRKNLE